LRNYYLRCLNYNALNFLFFEISKCFTNIQIIIGLITGNILTNKNNLNVLLKQFLFIFDKDFFFDYFWQIIDNTMSTFMNSKRVANYHQKHAVPHLLPNIRNTARRKTRSIVIQGWLQVDQLLQGLSYATKVTPNLPRSLSLKSFFWCSMTSQITSMTLTRIPINRNSFYSHKYIKSST